MPHARSWASRCAQRPRHAPGCRRPPAQCIGAGAHRPPRPTSPANQATTKDIMSQPSVDAVSSVHLDSDATFLGPLLPLPPLPPPSLSPPLPCLPPPSFCPLPPCGAPAGAGALFMPCWPSAGGGRNGCRLEIISPGITANGRAALAHACPPPAPAGPRHCGCRSPAPLTALLQHPGGNAPVSPKLGRLAGWFSSCGGRRCHRGEEDEQRGAAHSAHNACNSITDYGSRLE